MAFRDFWINHAQCADNHSSSSVDAHRLIAPIYAAGIQYAGGLLFGAILVRSRERINPVGCEVKSVFQFEEGEASNPTEVPMSDLVVIVYPSEEKSEEVRQRLLKLQKEYLITINDAVIAV
jgi:hypothetical protein